MSYLISNFFRKAESHQFPLSPASTCIYEDYVKSNSVTAYDFLNMSNERELLSTEYDANIDTYINHLKLLLRTHKNHTYMEEHNPLVFEWNYDGRTYSSTSLFFEYYMTHVFKITRDISKALIDADADKAFFTKTKESIAHLVKMLPHWTTKDKIEPFRPAIVNVEFLKSLVYFTHATQALTIANKAQSSAAIAFHSASHFYGKVWFRLPTYGTIALQRHMLCKALSLHAMASKIEENEENAEKLYSLYQETKGLLEKVNYEQAFVPDSIRKDNTFLQELGTNINSLLNVYYVTGSCNINDHLEKPRIIPLKVCPKLNKFGCKCKNDKVEENKN